MSIEVSFDEAEKTEQAEYALAMEVARLTRELAEAKSRAVRGQAESLLKDLVEALDSAFISSWQSTAAWQSQLDESREWLSARPESPKSSAYKFPSVDDLAQAIRRIDGNHSLGAGVLAEKIIEHFASKEPSNVE